jgi:4'-phosphopantetheinyl transferase
MTTVDVWLLPVDPGAADNPELLACLHHRERERIAGIGLADDRDRAVTGRAAARVEIGRRLDLPPAAVPLTDHGPPAVDGCTIGVSWAHSGSWVALALCEGRLVGVDVERVPERLDARGLAEIGVASLEEFVGLEAASKATRCAYGGRWPPRVAVRRLAAPRGYVAAVAAFGDDWGAELHMRSPLERRVESSQHRMSAFAGPARVRALHFPNFDGWVL